MALNSDMWPTLRIDVQSHREATVDYCAICMETHCDPCSLLCGHSFCGECIDQLLDYAVNRIALRCPLCRQPLRKGAKVAEPQV